VKLSFRFLFVMQLLLLAGCGSSPSAPPDPGEPIYHPQPIPIADTPVHLVQRFEIVFEYQDLGNYKPLLTDDFHFRFSADADPELFYRYPNWNIDDDIESTKHLFEGFVNTPGELVPAASRIDIALSGVQLEADSTHADSTRHYGKVAVAAFEMTIELPTNSDPVTYHVVAPHDFYVVRGDAAVLPGGTAADSTRWYIRRWIDRAPAPIAAKGPVLAAIAPTTMGQIKDRYRK